MNKVLTIAFFILATLSSWLASPVYAIILPSDLTGFHCYYMGLKTSGVKSVFDLDPNQYPATVKDRLTAYRNYYDAPAPTHTVLRGRLSQYATDSNRVPASNYKYEPIENLKDLRIFAQLFGLRASNLKVSEAKEKDFLNQTLAQLLKIPPHVLRQILMANIGTELVLNFITDLPQLADKKGVRISPNPSVPDTFDRLPGLLFSYRSTGFPVWVSVVAVKTVPLPAVTLGTILEQNGQALDLSMKLLYGTQLSERPGFFDISKATSQRSRDVTSGLIIFGNKSEVFAKGFAAFYEDSRYRKILASDYPELYAYMENLDYDLRTNKVYLPKLKGP